VSPPSWSLRVAVAAVLLALAGCAQPAPPAPAGAGLGGGPPADDGPDVVDGVATAHDGWDIAFINYMAPHDAVAGQMAALAQSQAASPQVKALATQIDAEPGDRFVTFSAMATAWHQPVPSTDPAAASGHDHGGGRTEADDLAALTPLRGAAFDATFLDVMVRHHEAGLKQAQQTIDNGTNPQVKDVARALVAAQTEQVARMRQMQQTAGKP
jgi:uncharacterized protein (DUF305 family)